MSMGSMSVSPNELRQYGSVSMFPDDFLKNPYKYRRKNPYRLKKFRTFFRHWDLNLKFQMLVALRVITTSE